MPGMTIASDFLFVPWQVGEFLRERRPGLTAAEGLVERALRETEMRLFHTLASRYSASDPYILLHAIEISPQYIIRVEV